MKINVFQNMNILEFLGKNLHRYNQVKMVNWSVSDEFYYNCFKFYVPLKTLNSKEAELSLAEVCIQEFEEKSNFQMFSQTKLKSLWLQFLLRKGGCAYNQLKTISKV